MPSEWLKMSRIIHHKITLDCGPSEVFEWFIEKDRLVRWLAADVRIEPWLGGRYELFWDLENPAANSTLDCRITAIEPGRMLAFDWKGPVQFAEFMNTADPLTHVTVVFFSVNNISTELHLIHTGWGGSDQWEAARQWFEQVWANALDKLQLLF